MALVTAKLLLKNPRATRLAVEVEASADSGAVHLCNPASPDVATTLVKQPRAAYRLRSS